MGKLNLQQTLLQYAVSHDPSEIILICWFVAQEQLLLPVFFLYYEGITKQFFFQDSLMSRRLKDSIYLKYNPNSGNVGTFFKFE